MAVLREAFGPAMLDFAALLVQWFRQLADPPAALAVGLALAYKRDAETAVARRFRETRKP
jgi:hypothetical protein